MQMGVRNLECRLISKGIKFDFLMKPGLPSVVSDLPAQGYKLSAFVDLDGNGRYTSGGMDLAEGAEPFWIYPDVIKVRARWETDLGIWRHRK